MISVDELQRVIHDALAETVPDIRDFEVEMFLSSILTSFGFVTITRADEYRTNKRPYDSSINNFISLGTFDFTDLPREDVVSAIISATGLPEQACNNTLDAIWNLLYTSASSGEVVEVERLGICKQYNGYGLQIELSGDLAMPTHDSPVPVTV